MNKSYSFSKGKTFFVMFLSRYLIDCVENILKIFLEYYDNGRKTAAEWYNEGKTSDEIMACVRRPGTKKTSGKDTFSC